jgi:GNAT superfamily N-acetyltransferase
MPFKVYGGSRFVRQARAFLAVCQERDPLAGLYDVGKLHWWWRDDAFDDPNNQRFWEGRDGTLGMLVLSEHHATFGFQVLPGLETRPEARALFAEGLAWLERFELLGSPERPSFYLRDAPGVFHELAREAGYRDSGTARVQSYLRQPVRPATTVSPSTFTVRPMGTANLVRGCPPLLREFARVHRAALYEPELHLVAVSRDGDLAAECICWWDEANATALFEPVAVAQAYVRRGMARDLMVEVLKRLAERDARLVKVSHDKHHRAAGRLYAALGFVAPVERRLYVKYR